VASSALVLQKLYENGADMWLTDVKGRFPLFVAAFLGRVDCVSFLLELGAGKTTSTARRKSGTATNTPRDPIADFIGAKDKQGDTALHASCLCGHIQCSMLLIYFLRCDKNRQGLSPDQLASRAGHAHLARLMQHVEGLKAQEKTSAEIFGCTFEDLSAVTLYYGSRWVKLYDCTANSVYYFDRVTNASQWERPVTYDESPRDEIRTDKAREVLYKFYQRYNPQKLQDMNEILAAFRNNYTELFISLVERYQVEDLSMFAGVSLD
jgi:ankyrin repeat protein